MASAKLTKNEHCVLWSIIALNGVSGGPAPYKDLADSIGLTLPVVSAAVKQLLQQGFLVASGKRGCSNILRPSEEFFYSPEAASEHLIRIE